MIKKVLFSVLVMLFCSSANAQYGYEFLILDDVTAQPFKDVIVAIYDTTKTKLVLKTKTDKDSKSSIDSLPTGSYIVLLSKKDYIPIEKNITINREKLNTYSEKPFRYDVVEILIPKKKTKSAIIRDGDEVPPPENRRNK